MKLLPVVLVINCHQLKLPAEEWNSPTLKSLSSRNTKKTRSMSSPMWLKYRNSMADAFADLARPEEVGKVFVGFQKYLYQLRAVA